MNHLKHVVAAFTVVAASVAVGAGPAAAAPTNGTDCHGVYLSYLATSGMAPGQLQQDYGTSVKDVQDITRVLCQP